MKRIVTLWLVLLGLSVSADTVIATDVKATRKLTIPSTTASVTASSGSLKIDSDGDASNITQSILSYHDGTRIMYGVFVDSIPTNDDYVLAYDGTAKKFVFQAQSGGGGSVSITGTPSSGQAAEWTSATAIQGVSTTGIGSYVKNDSAFIVNSALTNPKTDLLDFEGSTSGFVTMTVPAAAGTHTIKLPTTTGAANSILKTDGSGQWGWFASSGAVLTDGDKGDVTVGSTVSTLTIDNDVVSNAKMANMAASTIKARVTGSTGDPEDATLSQVLDLVGSAANGDMLVRSGGTWGRLAAPTQLSGSTLYYGPNGVEWVNPDTHFIYRNDFNILTSTAPGDFSNLSSSGSVAYMDPGANGIGGMNMSTGTTTTGYRHQFPGTAGSFEFGRGRTVVSWRVRLPNLSDGTDTYTAMVGSYDAVPSPVDGIWFQYTHSVNSGKWECKVADNSSTTTTDSTITVAANTWYTLTIDVNSGATEAKFYINGTLVHTESGANIPQTGRVTAIATAGITKSAGTTARLLSADYVDIYVKY